LDHRLDLQAGSHHGSSSRYIRGLGTNLSLLDGSSIEHLNLTSLNTDYTTTYQGDPGVLAFENQRYFTATSRDIGATFVVDIDVVEGSSFTENELLTEVSHQVDLAPITGLAVQGDRLYLTSAGYGDWADFIIVLRIMEDG
jgi:hypothetical protein